MVRAASWRSVSFANTRQCGSLPNRSRRRISRAAERNIIFDDAELGRALATRGGGFVPHSAHASRLIPSVALINFTEVAGSGTLSGGEL